MFSVRYFGSVRLLTGRTGESVRFDTAPVTLGMLLDQLGLMYGESIKREACRQHVFVCPARCHRAQGPYSFVRDAALEVASGSVVMLVTPISGGTD